MNSHDRPSYKPYERVETIDRVGYRDLIVPSSSDANMLLEFMRRMLADYGVISVADLYEVAGLDTTHHQTEIGWKSLNDFDIEIITVEDGYIFHLPDPILI